ncbi:hypothetical protein GCM10010840_27330 [Deinococcus aerolatus]|uniref:Uncharacterized protein n=1 Tax=Deinococcus aerolatus TaxID=522487 RepID=A0ABQ2GDF1_9DEIO|nr:hypothetical protein GCM10010840_27330 [Deinococcus aerolatus]
MGTERSVAAPSECWASSLVLLLVLLSPANDVVRGKPEGARALGTALTGRFNELNGFPLEFGGIDFSLFGHDDL